MKRISGETANILFSIAFACPAVALIISLITRGNWVVNLFLVTYVVVLVVLFVLNADSEEGEK